MKENEDKRKIESKINEFKNLCKSQNIGEIRKYIKHYDIVNSLNTRELNEDFLMNGHRLVKCNGLLNLIHDPNRSTHHEHLCNEILNNQILLTSRKPYGLTELMNNSTLKQEMTQ